MRGAAVGLLFALTACEVPPGAALDDGAPYVRTTRGGYVRSDAPPGIEVSLGSKLLRPAREALGPGPSGRRDSPGGGM